MYSDLFQQNTWQNLTQFLVDVWKIDAQQVTPRVYQGLHHGLSEVTLGLARLLPHKRKLSYIRGTDPYFELPMVALSKEGFDVQSADLHILEDPSEWVSSLDRESLFVLYSEDVPLIGKKLNVGPLEAALEGKRVFKVKVSHAAHGFRPPSFDLDKYMIQLHSHRQDCTLALLGNRARIGSLIAEGMVWPDFWKEDLKALYEKVQEQNRDRIQEFEGTLAGDFQPVFGPNEDRIWDRVVICWEDMDGSAFIEELAHELQVQLGPPGEESLLESSSLCRWGGLKTMDWLKNHGLTAEQIRGLVVLSAELITEDLPAKITSVREKVLKKQLG